MFEIWYCPNYPIESIHLAHRGPDLTERALTRSRLAEDIRENGLVNPVVVLNHRPKKLASNHCMQGLNRIHAMKLLGWSTVPCIFTGPCDHEPKVAVEWDLAHEYFFDGTLRMPTSMLQGLKLEGITCPGTFKYPTSKCQSPVRDGPYLHEDYKSISV